MARKDSRINAHGIDARLLLAGQWIKVRWNDAGDESALLLEVEQRQATFKGTRRLKLLVQDINGWYVQDRADSDQVVSIDGFISPLPIDIQASI
jgi:hypothetical protein